MNLLKKTVEQLVESFAETVRFVVFSGAKNELESHRERIGAIQQGLMWMSIENFNQPLPSLENDREISKVDLSW